MAHSFLYPLGSAGSLLQKFPTPPATTPALTLTPLASSIVAHLPALIERARLLELKEQVLDQRIYELEDQICAARVKVAGGEKWNDGMRGRKRSRDELEKQPMDLGGEGSGRHPRALDEPTSALQTEIAEAEKVVDAERKMMDQRGWKRSRHDAEIKADRWGVEEDVRERRIFEMEEHIRVLRAKLSEDGMDPAGNVRQLVKGSVASLAESIHKQLPSLPSADSDVFLLNAISIKTRRNGHVFLDEESQRLALNTKVEDKRVDDGGAPPETKSEVSEATL